jgi:NitT/TauT family transport system substrate-binding protein
MFKLASRLLILCLFAMPVLAQERVSVAYPGPLTISFLPLELAPKIGADAAEGLHLVLRHTTGGGIAIQQMLNRNVDFVAAGMPAALSAKAGGGDVAAIAALNDLPVFVLSVRSDLKGKVKRPRDLAGRVIGVTTSSLAVKTISQQLVELLLEIDGVPPGQIRIVPAGQNWEEHSAKLRSGSADAIMGFEPVATRLADAGLAFPLFNLGDPVDAARIPGAGLLHGALITRGDVLRETPQRAEKMVAVMRRALQWMAGRSPEEIVDKLGVPDPDTRATLLKLLARYPRLFSPDGKFSERQLRETAAFYNAGEGAERPVAIDKVVDARWAGRKP